MARLDPVPLDRPTLFRQEMTIYDRAAVAAAVAAEAVQRGQGSLPHRKLQKIGTGSSPGEPFSMLNIQSPC